MVVVNKRRSELLLSRARSLGGTKRHSLGSGSHLGFIPTAFGENESIEGAAKIFLKGGRSTDITEESWIGEPF